MLQLTSSGFQNNGDIPARFTCEGDDTSPELNWTSAPGGAKSFALIVHDPDAPRAGGFTHWVVFNIPANINHIPENTPRGEKLSQGGIQGKNDSGRNGYMGPCPPSGTHRYFFRLYALDNVLDLGTSIGKTELEAAMKGHIIAEAELMGTYKKGARKAA